MRPPVPSMAEVSMQAMARQNSPIRAGFTRNSPMTANMATLTRVTTTVSESSRCPNVRAKRGRMSAATRIVLIKAGATPPGRDSDACCRKIVTSEPAASIMEIQLRVDDRSI